MYVHYACSKLMPRLGIPFRHAFLVPKIGRLLKRIGKFLPGGLAGLYILKVPKTVQIRLGQKRMLCTSP